MAQHTVIVTTFEDSSRAYEAMSDLRTANAEGNLSVHAAVILEREPDGRLHVADPADARIGGATLGGGLVGLLVGLLGGPLGLLLGFGAGAAIGGYFDVRRADRSELSVGALARHLAPGTTAIMAELTEFTPEVVNRIMGDQGGVTLRRDAEIVLAEIETAEDAAKEAEKAANRIMREKRREERREKWDARVDALMEKFSREGA